MDLGELGSRSLCCGSASSSRNGHHPAGGAPGLESLQARMDVMYQDAAAPTEQLHDAAMEQ